MSFMLGTRSRTNLIRVQPVLVKVVERSIQITRQDFVVQTGVRTAAEQRAHVAGGTSWTMNSKHLLQKDGWSHAVDLVPLVLNKMTWDWERCYAVAAAMAEAAQDLHVDLRWGGVWDRNIHSYGAAQVRQANVDYVRRRRAAGKRAAIDGPHFELI